MTDIRPRNDGIETRLELDAPPARRGLVAGARRLRTFQSLEERSFRWFMLSMTTHWSAMQMQQLVRGILVFQLTGSFAALGLIGLVNAIPRLMLALVGGVMADRLSKRLVIQLGQAVSLVMALVIAALLIADLLRFEHLLISAFVQGAVNSIAMPSRQSMIPELVGRDRLTNAIALNAGSRNTMRLLAPALGGVLFAVMGAAGVYLFMSALYFLAIVTLAGVPLLAPALVRGEQDERRGAAREAIADIADGLRYIARSRVLILILLVHFCVAVFSMPYQRMLPGFVLDVLDGGEAAVGLLMTLTGLGALIGSLVIASVAPHRRGRNLLLSSLLFGGALLLFAFSTQLWLAIIAVILVGLGQSMRQSLNNALVQSNVSDEYRGRVMSVYMMEMGLVSLGAFGVGVLAEVIGIQWALGGAAMFMLLAVLAVYLFVPSYRRLD